MLAHAFPESWNTKAGCMYICLVLTLDHDHCNIVVCHGLPRNDLIITLFIFFSSLTNFVYSDIISFGSSTYEGEVKKGKAYGEGIFTFSDGSKYEGNWLNNLKHGTGIMTWTDGTNYNGKWKNDSMNG